MLRSNYILPDAGGAGGCCVVTWHQTPEISSASQSATSGKGPREASAVLGEQISEV